MSGSSLKFGSLLLTGCLCVGGLAATAVAQKGGVRKLSKKPQKQDPAAVLPPYTPAPLQPVPLDQVPAVAPHVQYEGGELTIEAHNSTLSDVLKAVRQKTGAELDIPANANERVVADLGPGPARDVLAQLLNGTHFNYVMMGSTTDPTAIQSIVLTPRSGGPDTAAATATASRVGLPQHSFPTPVVNNTVDTSSAVDNDASDDADTTDDQSTAADQGDQQNQNPAQQTPKTPEQLLQELQRQQQQQQQQQQQNPQTSQPPQGIFPNQPPTVAPANPNKPD